MTDRVCLDSPALEKDKALYVDPELDAPLPEMSISGEIRVFTLCAGFLPFASPVPLSSLPCGSLFSSRKLQRVGHISRPSCQDSCLVHTCPRLEEEGA